jgi:hypothetical protein
VGIVGANLSTFARYLGKIENPRVELTPLHPTPIASCPIYERYSPGEIREPRRLLSGHPSGYEEMKLMMISKSCGTSALGKAAAGLGG